MKGQVAVPINSYALFWLFAFVVPATVITVLVWRMVNLLEKSVRLLENQRH